MRTHLLTLSLAAAVSAAPASAKPAQQVRLQATLAEPVMLAGEKQLNYLKIGLTGFEFADPERGRPPVNVALVLDKSGSMGGEKIRRARDAAKMAIERLSKDDIVSVVTYDSTVRVVVPATKVADKEEIFRLIDGISADGNTALFGGVSKGANEVRKFLAEGQVSRVVLVSDGLANVGPDTPGALGELGAALRKEGISVSTVGLGSGYNEDLMFALAERSDGNHAFAESGEELVAIFDAEFGDVLSVSAQEVLVRVECAPGIRPVRALGREAEISGQTCTVLLNQLYSSQEKYLLLEVEVPPGEAGGDRAVARVSVSYANMATGVTDELSASAGVRFTGDAEEVAAKADRDVKIASVMQIATLNNIKAMELRDQGKVEEAKQVLLSNGLFCEDNGKALGSKDLVQWGAFNTIDADNLDGAAWTRTRKAMRADQYKNQSQVPSRGYNTRGVQAD